MAIVGAVNVKISKVIPSPTSTLSFPTRTYAKLFAHVSILVMTDQNVGTIEI